jgi:hypothetical protein
MSMPVHRTLLPALLVALSAPGLAGAQVASIPGYTLVQTLAVPTNGNAVWSQVLAAGVDHRLVAFGSFNIGGFQADAEYIWNGFIPGTYDHCVFGGLSVCDYGIAVNDGTVGGFKGIAWGAYRNDHTYVQGWTGTGEALRFSFHDDNFADNFSTLGVQIFAPAVPEPAAALMMLAGLAGLGLRLRRGR